MEGVGTNLNAPALALRRRPASNSTGQRKSEMAPKPAEALHLSTLESEAQRYIKLKQLRNFSEWAKK